MATDFIMPQVPVRQDQHAFYQPNPQKLPPQAALFAAAPVHPAAYPAPANTQYSTAPSSAQISPLSTSNNASPTSPRNNLGRGTRPMYMPAVLRPTEFPSKAPPPRPIPGDGEDDDDDDAEPRTPRPNSSFIGGLNALGRLSRRSTGDSGKCVDGKWNLDLFPQPTGTPTRKHWKPDHESPLCDHATCKKYFTTWTRRHHCRKCGNIFCNYHSRFEVPLDQDASYNPRGVSSRACAHCFAQFKEWRSRTNSQASSLSSSEGNLADHHHPHTPLASPTSVLGMRLPPHHPSHQRPGGGGPDAAQSVPRDWNWSTF
ncbi:vacuolar segregation protein pep7 [Echria macrotheca]|uniref:Vacuolar segregation protein pep7 n=1 Tax=Echria macrotheca TaxID=438768 RepID=A0AAJ0B552_9PEZI|nr:vacuolar segregation protein pep7 [Echria macrotheca]